MDDLSLLLASKDVFLSLSMQKIKTLKQAEQHNKNNPSQKVQNIIDQYYGIQEGVFAAMNDVGSYVDFTSFSLVFNEKDPMSYYWHHPSIIQIMGFKGSGKTALALSLCQQFAHENSEKTVKILNCAGGITSKRLSSLQEVDYTYTDIFSVEDIQELLKSLQKSKEPGLLFLDGVNSLIMGASQRIGLNQHLTNLKANGWCILVTNLIQGKLQVSQKEIMNAQSYFPNIFGSTVDCRLRIDENEKEQDTFTIRILKIINNKSYQFIATMTENGFSEIVLQKMI